MFHFKYPNFIFRFNNPLANLLTSLFLKNLDSKFTPLNATKMPLKFQSSEFLQEKMQTDKVPAKTLYSQQIESQQK